MDRLQRREALAGRRGGGGSSCGGGGGLMSRRHGRFHHGGSDSDDGSEPAPRVAVVDQVECTARSCRSCVAVSLADCIALGCCPCAVVSLLGLALVKAPLAVGRRCVRRLRRRHVMLQHKKRVRDLEPVGARPVAPKRGVAHGHPSEVTSKGEDNDTATADSPVHRDSAASSDLEKVWLEMYQFGQWGFGRLSISVNPPTRPDYVPTGRNTDGDGCENDVRN